MVHESDDQRRWRPYFRNILLLQRLSEIFPALAHKTQAVSVSNQQIMDCSGVDCLDAVNGTMTKAFQNIMNWGGGVDADESYPYRDRACVSWDARCDPSMIDPRCKFWCPPHGEIYTQQPRSPLSGDQ